MFRRVLNAALKTPKRRLFTGPSTPAEQDSHLVQWKRATYFIALPSLVVTYIYSFIILGEDLERPDFAEYEHIYMRRRPFPFGDGNRSVLHNPMVNGVPGVGYDEELPEHDHH